MNDKRKKQKLIFKKQYAAPAVFLMLSVFVIGFGFLYIRHEINSPFSFLKEVFERNQEKVFNKTQEEQQEILALQTKDTDGDGLSDFEEMYVYGTSPYLEDTNSNGVSDRQEITNQENPTCPAGQNCGSSEITDNLSRRSGTPPAAVATDNSALPAVSNLSNVSDIRQKLIAAGVSAELLNGVDDATLIEVYQETAEETGIDPTQLDGSGQTAISFDSSSELPLSNSELKTSAATQVTEYFQNLSADDIRQLLASSGVSADILSQIDDATLKELAQQALQSQLEKQLQQNQSN